MSLRDFIQSFTGNNFAQRKHETDCALKEERGRLKNNVQSIKSGARVMSNMAGMLKLMEEDVDKNR